MPEWLPSLIVTVIIIFAGLLGWLIKVAWPVVRKMSHFVDDVVGEPDRPGIPGRPGLMVRVAHIEHEVKTNHGSSLKDAVKRVEQKQSEQGEQLDVQSDKIAELHERYTKPKEHKSPTE